MELKVYAVAGLDEAGRRRLSAPDASCQDRILGYVIEPPTPVWTFWSQLPETSDIWHAAEFLAAYPKEDVELVDKLYARFFP